MVTLEPESPPVKDATGPDLTQGPDSDNSPAPANDDAKPEPPVFKPGVRFWAIMVAIGFAGLLTALEATIVSTALPSVISDLGGGDSYIWVANGYFLAMYVDAA
jgi:hypothetical protein